MRYLAVVAFLVTTLASIEASAQRTPVLIVDHENVAVVTGTGKPTDGAEIRTAFVTAGAKLNWTMGDSGEGMLVGTLLVRNKHTIVIDVAYAPDRYTVKYKNSVNMKYGLNDEGRPVIHPFYNRWVNELLTGVKAELLKL